MPNHRGVPIGLHNSLHAPPSSALLASTIAGKEISAAHEKLDNSCMVHVLSSHRVIGRPCRWQIQQAQENACKVNKQQDETGFLDLRPVVAHASVQINHLAAPLITNLDDLQMGGTIGKQPDPGDPHIHSVHCAEFWSAIRRRSEDMLYLGVALLELSLIFLLLLLLLLLVFLLPLLPRECPSTSCARTCFVNLQPPFDEISSPQEGADMVVKHVTICLAS